MDDVPEIDWGYIDCSDNSNGRNQTYGDWVTPELLRERTAIGAASHFGPMFGPNRPRLGTTRLSDIDLMTGASATRLDGDVSIAPRANVESMMDFPWLKGGSSVDTPDAHSILLTYSHSLLEDEFVVYYYSKRFVPIAMTLMYSFFTAAYVVYMLMFMNTQALMVNGILNGVAAVLYFACGLALWLQGSNVSDPVGVLAPAAKTRSMRTDENGDVVPDVVQRHDPIRLRERHRARRTEIIHFCIHVVNFIFGVGNLYRNCLEIYSDESEESRFRNCTGAMHSDILLVLMVLVATMLVPLRSCFNIPLHAVGVLVFFLMIGRWNPPVADLYTKQHLWAMVLVALTEFSSCLMFQRLKERRQRLNFQLHLRRHVQAAEAEYVQAQSEKFVQAQLPLRLQMIDECREGGGADRFLFTAWSSHVAAVLLSVHGISEWISSTAPCDMVVLLERIATVFDGTLEEVREMASDLRPSGPDASHGSSSRGTSPDEEMVKCHGMGDDMMMLLFLSAPQSRRPSIQFAEGDGPHIRREMDLHEHSAGRKDTSTQRGQDDEVPHLKRARHDADELRRLGGLFVRLCVTRADRISPPEAPSVWYCRNPQQSSISTSCDTVGVVVLAFVTEGEGGYAFHSGTRNLVAVGPAVKSLLSVRSRSSARLVTVGGDASSCSSAEEEAVVAQRGFSGGCVFVDIAAPEVVATYLALYAAPGETAHSTPLAISSFRPPPHSAKICYLPQLCCSSIALLHRAAWLSRTETSSSHNPLMPGMEGTNRFAIVEWQNHDPCHTAPAQSASHFTTTVDHYPSPIPTESISDEIGNQARDPILTFIQKRVELANVPWFPLWTYFVDADTEAEYQRHSAHWYAVFEVMLGLGTSFLSLAALAAVCLIDAQSNLSPHRAPNEAPLRQEPLLWCSVGMASCVVLGMVLACVPGLSPSSVVPQYPLQSRVCHVAAAYVPQVCYMLAVFYDPRPLTVIKESQLPWLLVMLNWSTNRPLISGVLVMWASECVVCVLFCVRAVFWFDGSSESKSIALYIAGGAVLYTAAIRSGREYYRRGAFAGEQQLEYLLDVLEGEYHKLEAALASAVPGGVAGKLVRNVRRREKETGHYLLRGLRSSHDFKDTDALDDSYDAWFVHPLGPSSFHLGVDEYPFAVVQLKRRVSSGSAREDAKSMLELIDVCCSFVEQCSSSSLLRGEVQVVKVTQDMLLLCASPRTDCANDDKDEERVADLVRCLAGLRNLVVPLGRSRPGARGGAVEFRAIVDVNSAVGAVLGGINVSYDLYGPSLHHAKALLEFLDNDADTDPVMIWVTDRAIKTINLASCVGGWLGGEMLRVKVPFYPSKRLTRLSVR